MIGSDKWQVNAHLSEIAASHVLIFVLHHYTVTDLRLFSASGNKSSNWLTRSMWISTTSTAKSPLCAQNYFFFMPSRLWNKEIMKKSNPKKVRWDMLQPQQFAKYLWHYPTQSTRKRTEVYPLCNRICLGQVHRNERHRFSPLICHRSLGKTCSLRFTTPGLA